VRTLHNARARAPEAVDSEKDSGNDDGVDEGRRNVSTSFIIVIIVIIVIVVAEDSERSRLAAACMHADWSRILEHDLGDDEAQDG